MLFSLETVSSETMGVVVCGLNPNCCYNFHGSRVRERLVMLTKVLKYVVELNSLKKYI